jgi:molybdate transport system permease protein
VTPDNLSPLWISVETSIAATALAFVLGVGAAAILYRYQGRGRGVFDGLLTLPLVLPPTVVGFFLLLIFGRRSAIGQALEHIGLRIAFSWPATVIAATVVAFPLMYRASLGAFEQVNPNLLGAARTLGASEWRTFRRVLLPLARPGVLAGLVLTFARALGEFGATLMLAGNIPGKTQTMPVAIFFAADGGDMRLAFSWVVLIVIISLATIAGLNYWTPRVRAPHRRPIAATRSPEWLPAQPALTSHPVARVTNPSSLTANLTKSFPGFELSVALSATGDRLGLLGASGSGKSMTLQCIAGLAKPDKGSVVLNGRILFDTAKGIDVSPADRRIGIVFQDYALFPHLTVRDNIGFSLHRHTPTDRQERILRWSKLTQIESLLESYPAELSGGQRQRAALARALAMEPEALLLDEPFSALDPHLRRRTEEQVREALERYTGVTIFVTHDRDEAFRFCRTLAVLSEGRVAAIGPRDDIFRNPGSLAVARLTGCKNFARISRTGSGRVRAVEWECDLEVPDNTIPEQAEFVAIRAHDLRILDHSSESNTFSCWLITSVQSPFETTLYLRLHASASEGDPSHLEAEISREEWARLSDRPQPWQVTLDSDRLLFLAG